MAEEPISRNYYKRSVACLNDRGVPIEKITYGTLLAIIIFAFDNYQPPILSTEEVIVQAYDHLRNQPPRMVGKIEPIQIELNEVPVKNISSVWYTQEGFVNRLANKPQWEVTIKYQHVVSTVVMDAYTGGFLELSGPLN